MTPRVILDGGRVVIRAPRCVLVLEPAEVAALVRLDPETWARAIRRGKHWRRGEATARRGSPAARETNGRAV
ncbi:MAG: hypothetical protein HY825_13690 [Acidobacteria bacterium]|nr:hypothetical protein [Acidobacteriota bacterium]